MNLKIDDLHDAEIIGVSVDRWNSCARLDFRLEDGALCSAELRGVRAFRCEDLTTQNVVSRLRLSQRKAMARKELAQWLDWSTSLSDADSWLNSQQKLDWMNACETEGLSLVIVEPSAGAQIAAVCEHIALT